MSGWLVALLGAAPVVGLGPGSGISLGNGLVLTTHQVALGVREAVLADGGSALVAATLSDDAASDLALLKLDDASPHGAVFAPEPVEAGAMLTVVTATSSYDAVVESVTPGAINLAVPDAGELAGAALVNRAGHLYGMMRGPRLALPAGEIAELSRVLEPAGSRGDLRVRNLGISAAFFVGLAVWWVYRSRTRRY